jgi:hypothetical protein
MEKETTVQELRAKILKQIDAKILELQKKLNDNSDKN